MEWESQALMRAPRSSAQLTCVSLHRRNLVNDLAAEMWMHFWGQEVESVQDPYTTAGRNFLAYARVCA